MSSTVPIAPVTPDAVAPAGRTEREHRYDVDLIRLLASVGVILCHSGSAFLDAVGRTEAGAPASTGRGSWATPPAASPSRSSSRSPAG